MATTRTQPAKLPALPRLPADKILELDHLKPALWLYHWFRDQAEFEAIDRWINANMLRVSDVLYHAMCTGRWACRDEAEKSFDLLVDRGHLLYAWAGTTALKTGVPA